MKQAREAFLFIVVATLLSACFDQPEFDHSPAIKYEGLYFGKSPNGEDSLVVSVSFKDGDGDLGFDSGPDALDSPYHQINFFANDNGQLFSVPSRLIQSFAGYRYKKTGKTPGDPSYYIHTPSKQVGELITLSSRSEGFSLPPFVSPFNCFVNEESYLHEQQEPDTVFIRRGDRDLIKDLHQGKPIPI
jgi:hypothetical protein